jgi:hypothetical protein
MKFKLLFFSENLTNSVKIVIKSKTYEIKDTLKDCLLSTNYLITDYTVTCLIYFFTSCNKNL